MRPALIRPVTILTALLATSAAAAFQQAAPPGAVVSGRVIDAASGAPVESAVVSIRASNGMQIDQVRSRATGDYVLRDVPPGAWMLSVTRYGYEQLAGRTVPLDVAPGAAHVRADLRVSKLAVLGGQVTDDHGDPLVGATVRVHTLTTFGTWDPAQSAVTDDRGRYRIWTLRAGERLVSVQPVYASTADGTASVSGMTADAVVSAGGQTRAFRAEFHGGGAVLSLAPGQVAGAVNLRMTRVPAGPVSGRLDGAAETIGNVGVQLLHADDPPGVELRDPIVASRTTSSADGRFTFPVVPAGRYVVKVLQRPIPAASGSPSVTVEASPGISGTTVAYGNTGPRTLTKGPTFWASLPIVTEGTPIRDLAISLRTGAHITGRIAFDGDGTRPTPAQLNQAFLTAWSPRREYHPALIETTGEFRTAGLPGGRYALRLSSVVANGVTWHPKTITLDGRDVTDGYLDVGDTDVHDVVITVTDRAPTLAGTIRDARGGPAQNVFVAAYPADPAIRSAGTQSTWRVKVTRSATGTFSLGAMLPGDYLVVAASDELTDRWNDTAVLDLFSPVATRIRLSPGDQARLDLVAVTAIPSRPNTSRPPRRSGPSDEADVDVDRDELEDPQQRDVTAGVAERGAIQGRVTADVAGRTPVRHAMVTIAPTAGGPTLTQHADDDGRFAFGEVAAGRYRVSASKPAHLASEHGAKQPGRPGVPVAVSARGTATISLVLPPSSVITGRVADDRGRPIADAGVRALVVRTSDAGPSIVSAPTATPAEALTDDRGEYRIYGLPPGEYYVGATPPPAAVVGRETTEAEMVWVRSARGPAAAAAAAAAPPRGSTVAQAPSFYPSAGTLAQAVPVALGLGDERAGVDIRLRGESVYTLTGRIATSTGQPAPGARITLMPEGLVVPTARFGSSSTPGLGYSYGGLVNVTANTQGELDIRSLAPGRYTLVAREAKAGASGTVEWTSAPVVIDAADRRDVVFSLQPTATVVAAFDSSAAALPGGVSRLSIALTPASTAPGAVTISGVKPDAGGRFTARGVAPGSYWLRVTGLPAGWTLHSAASGDRDVLDRPLIVNPGGETMDVTVRVTDRPSQIAGTFTDASGRPATDYLVIVFPADRAYWRAGSRHIQAVRPATDGRFAIRALPAGSYRLAAVSDAAPDEWFDPEYLAKLLAGAIVVEVGDGETRTQDIQVRR